jgi:uncharacterized protein (TIGR00730 family)
MERICVFCGSGSGTGRLYIEAAQEMGKILVRENYTLVYGGGTLGLMGVIACGVMNAGGKVIGVIPRSLADKEVAKQDITDLRIVKNMHERKAMMAELSDGFIAMPGGIGTLEEFAEIITWAQLGFHTKPCGLLNTGHYYDPLIAFLDRAVEERFFSRAHRSLLIIDDSPESLIRKMQAYRPPAHIEEWAGRKVD